MDEYRIEHDTMGEVRVPAQSLYGAQTARSLDNFKIGDEKMPLEMIYALALVKKAAALANFELGKLSQEKRDMILRAADEILSGEHDLEFPLSVWQTGSGTQTNMNVNEVIANRGNAITGRKLLHPNDDVNMSQSSNDTFPSALNIAAILIVKRRVLPAIRHMRDKLLKIERESEGIVKTGRTHLQDAVPIRFSQEVMGWRGMLERDLELIETLSDKLLQTALGGTAVGTGLNAPKGFDVLVAKKLSELTGENFAPSENKFTSLTSLGTISASHGALKALASDLMKIANDVRFLASGPRCGFGEIVIPANEPGSSIMPGKVNPTQCEAVTMVSVRVMGNDAAIGIAASQGNFELNVFQPVTAYSYLQSARLLADCMISFSDNCLDGLYADRKKMGENLSRTLMTVTALNPIIGYENSAKLAKRAFDKCITIKEACLELGLMTEDEFDRAFIPENMA